MDFKENDMTGFVDINSFDDSDVSPEQQEILKSFRHDLVTQPIRPLTPKEREIYAAAVFVANEKLPSFRDALAVLSPYMDATCQTAYTDQYARVGLSYWFFYLADMQTKAFTLLHESMHVLNSHFSRADHMKIKPKMMNYAGDLEINSNLSVLHGMEKIVENFLIPEKFDFPKFKTMEQYSILLKDTLDDMEDKMNQSDNSGSDSSENSDSGSSQNSSGSSDSSDSSDNGSSGQDTDGDNQDSGDSSSSGEGQGSESGENSQSSGKGEGSPGDSSSGQGGSNSSSSENGSSGMGHSYDQYSDELRGKEKKRGNPGMGDLMNEKNGVPESGEGDGDPAKKMEEWDGHSFDMNNSQKEKKKGSQVKVNPTRYCDESNSRRSDAADNIGVDKSSIAEQNIARNNTMARVVEKYNQDKSRGYGSSSDFLKIAISHMSPPKVDWRDVFRRVLGNFYSSSVIGRNHLSYRRVNRRYSQGSVILPGTIDYIPTAMFGIDTSGSMSQNDYEKLIVEIEDIMKKGIRGKESLKVFSVDTSIKNVKPVSKVKDIDLFGGGGTDMSVAFAYLNSLKKKECPDIFVLGTDGYTDWNRVLNELYHATYKSIILVTEKGGYDSAPPALKKMVPVIDVSSDR